MITVVLKDGFLRKKEFEDMLRSTYPTEIFMEHPFGEFCYVEVSKKDEYAFRETVLMPLLHKIGIIVDFQDGSD